MVGCKHPNGVVLNLDNYVVVNPANNLIRRVGGGATVTLKGWSHRFNEPDPTAETGGYRLTPVPADFWEKWLATHQDFPLLQDDIIKGPPARGSAIDQAKALAEVPKLYAPSSGQLKAAEYNKND